MRKYEKDIPADPSRYYVKDDPKYKATHYPELTLIPSRNTSPSHTSANTATNTIHQFPDNMSYISIAAIYVIKILIQKMN